MTPKQAAVLDSWADAQASLNTIRGFLEWCDEQKIELATWMLGGHRMLPLNEDREAMLARYLDIDTVQLERARQALLKKARAS